MDLPTGPGAREEKRREDSSLPQQFLLRYETTEQQMCFCWKRAGYFRISATILMSA